MEARKFGGYCAKHDTYLDYQYDNCPPCREERESKKQRFLKALKVSLFLIILLSLVCVELVTWGIPDV